MIIIPVAALCRENEMPKAAIGDASAIIAVHASDLMPFQKIRDHHNLIGLP
jgi:hypothetical protein